KATLDVEAPASGVLGRILAEPGSEVAALSVIATIFAVHEVDRADIADPSAETMRSYTASGDSRNSSEAASSECTAAAHQAADTARPEQLNTREPEQPTSRIFISPRAMRLAEARGLEWRALSGTGPEGAIVERDILAWLGDLRRIAATPLAQKA